MDETIKKQEDRLLNLISKAVNYRKNNRDKEYLTNMAFYEGNWWYLPELKDDKPFLIKSDINHIKPAYDLRLASIYASDYMGDLEALSADDVDKIQSLDVMYKAEWKRLKMDEKIKHSIKIGGLLGESYLVLNYDLKKVYGGSNARNKGSLTCDIVPTTSVYVDPSATSFYESDYHVVQIRRTLEWVTRNKPQWLVKLKARGADKPGMSTATDSGEIFIGHDYTTEQNNIFLVNMIYEKALRKDVQAINMNYIINGILVESDENFPFDFSPLFQYTCEECEQTPYGIPMLRGTTTAQKVVSLIESAINNLSIHYAVPTRLVSDECGLDPKKVSKLSGAAGVVYKVIGDPTKAIHDVRPPAIDAQLLVVRDSFVGNIKSHLGVDQVYQGNIGTAGNTVGGAATAMDRATMIDTLLLTQIEKFVERLTYGFIKYLVRYKKNETFYSKTKKQNGVSFNKFTIDSSLENIDYEYSIDLSIKTQNDKSRQYQTLTQLYQLQNQYKDPNKVINVLDIVKMGELDNYDDLFERYKNMNEEALNEKSKLIMELIEISMTPKLDGTNLIDPETVQAAILDVINDDNDLTVIEEVFKTYEAYQSEVMKLEQDVQNTMNENGVNQEQAQADAERQNLLNNKLGEVAGGIQQ